MDSLLTLLDDHASLTHGLLGYWSFEEATGLRYPRAGAMPLAWTPYNTPALANGRVGGAVEFLAASEQYLELADNPALRPGGRPFTIAGWSYLPNLTATEGYMLSKWGASDYEYSLRYEWASTSYRWACARAATTQMVTSVGITEAGWHFVIAWVDPAGNEVGLRVDGGEAVTTALGASAVYASTNPLWIGRHVSTYRGGRLDELGIWGRLLTTREQDALYNDGQGLRWPLNTGQATLVEFGVFTDAHYADADAAIGRSYRDADEKLSDATAAFAARGITTVISLGDLVDDGGSAGGAATDIAVIDAVYQNISDRHYVLGNHDLVRLTKAEFLSAVGQAASYYSFDRGGAHFVVLDACFRSDDDADPYAAGNFNWEVAYVPPTERSWLAADLAATTKPVVVICHNRLDDAGTVHCVANAAAVRAILEAAGNVVVVLTGHTHANAATMLNGIPYYSLEALVDGDYPTNAYGIVRVHEGGHVSLLGEGNCQSQ